MAKRFGLNSVVRAGLAASASIMALGLAAPAFAQDAAAEDTAKADENEAGRDIVVTAQFRGQKLQDTPLSITAVDATLLQSRNQTDLSQIARQAPNVTLNAMGGAYGSSLGASVRGIGQFDFNPAYEPGVGMYVDDVYYPTLTGGIFDLLDLDRVEVLRGPQGTLTGRNSIGGAIKLFSRKPGGDDNAQVQVTAGSRNRIDVRAAAGFNIAAGIDARVSGVYKHQNGYIDQVDYGCAHPGNAAGIAAFPSTPAGCVMAKLGEVNYSGVRGALRLRPTDGIDLTITADYTYENRTNAGEVVTQTNAAMAPYICGPYCTYASFWLPANFTPPALPGPGGQVGASYFMPNTTKFDGWGISANGIFTLSDAINITSITAYRSYRQVWGTDDDFSPLASKGAAGFNDLSFWFFSQELRVNAKLGDIGDLTVGGFYSDQKSVYFTRQDIRYIAPGLNFQFMGNDPVNADSRAVFGTVILRPTPALTVTGGLRYTKEHKDYTFVRLNYDGTVSYFLGALNGLTANYNGAKTDWRFSADYRVSPQLMIYASAGTGFKGGGVTARPFDAAQALNGNFGPESVTAYEAGFKADLFDRKLRLNVAGFINDYKDIQLPLITCASLGSAAPCGARQNAGSGKIKGFEVEMFAHPWEGFDLDASVSHLFGNWSVIDPRVGNAILITDPIVSPNWKWSLGVQQKLSLGSFGSLTPRIDFAYTGKSTAGRLTGGGPIDYFPAYTLGNLRITYKNSDEDLSVSFEVQNLFDKYYTPFRFAAVYAFSGTIYSQVGRPREWAVTVKKTF